MLTELLNDWQGAVEIDGKSYDSVKRARSAFKTISDNTCIVLRSRTKKASTVSQSVSESAKKELRISVKRYMTETASPGFDFMAKFNNNVPMPMRTMVGTIEKETRGMYFMSLHGKAEPTVRCMRCGRVLTNPTSQIYGIGPECMEKLGLVRIEITDVETIRKRLIDVTWKGWVIKSAITEMEELEA